MHVRYMDFISKFDFQLVQVPGTTNVIADALSRKEINAIETDDEKLSLIDDYHALGHFGPDMVYKKLRSDGYNWTQMRELIQMRISTCIACARNNIQEAGYHPLKPGSVEDNPKKDNLG